MIDRWNENFAGEIKIFGENLPQFHFVLHKSHTTLPGPPATNGLSYGTAYTI
jgi:hypothetical protein